MRFSEYRSKSFKAVWSRIHDETEYSDYHVCRMPGFSTWEMDDICADNWANANPVGVCVSTLFSYIVDDVIIPGT